MHILIPALHRPLKPTGVCRHAVNLAQCLADTDKITKVTLVVGTWQRHYFETSFTLSSEKIKLISVDIKNSSLSRNIWFLSGLPQLAKSVNPDLIHLSFPFPFFRPLFSVPVVATIHDLYPYECPENFGYPNVLFNRWFLKQCVNNSDGISCVSKLTLENVKQYFPAVSRNKKTAVVYNYVDFSNVHPQVSKNLDIIDTPFLLSVAQHRKNKNLELLIQAYSSLMKHERLSASTKLIIVGSSGPETENLHNQIIQLSLQNRVLMFSSIEDGELCWLYQNCELFVIPSSTEGFCLPLAEAIYFSCKVVCSDIPIFREIGATNCTYFQLEAGSVENLTKAIAQTMKQPSYSKALDNYRFTREKIAVQYLKLYSKIIETQKS